MISNLMEPLTLELEERGGKGDIQPNGAIDFAMGVVRRGKGDSKPNGAINFRNGVARG